MQEDNQTIQKKVEELLQKLTLKEKASMVAGKDTWHTVPVDRLGIPSMTMTDGPHGVRASNPENSREYGPTTCFPTGISMAASWNTELIERVGAALADETRAMGCDVLLGPCVNIVRHPLAGRNFEAYSEDPFHAGTIGIAWVKGLQSKRIGASLKHFACNNQEIERGRGSSIVDERTLREIYLTQFEMIVKETQPYTVMCSYNRLNGAYASQNNHLLREILKNEWGFEGLVVSDWGANHTIFESIKNGLDIEMPGPAKYYGRLLEEAVNNWQLDESALNDAVRRILTILFKTGKFDDISSLPAGSVNTPEHQALARELSEESITLLKNKDNILPLHKDQLKSIAVIGPNAAEDRIGGGGSSFVDPPYRISPIEGLRKLLGNQVTMNYEIGCDNWVTPPVINPDFVTLPDGSAHGFKAEYFNNTTFSGVPFVRHEVKLDHWWWGDALRSFNITGPYFSARWSGVLTAPVSGQFTFSISNTSSCKLFIDGRLLVDHKSAQAETLQSPEESCKSAVIILEAGKTYDLKLEFVKENDDVFARLLLAFANTFPAGEDHRMERAAKLASQADVALIFAGYPEGHESEGGDRPDMKLTGPQTELIRAVAKANPHTIVVLNVGSPIEMPWIDDVAGIVLAYYPGQEGGNAVARVLLGDVNPSGKLPETYPVRLEDTPAYINYPGTREVNYGEGIFVGYRYYDKRDLKVLFPFGFGISYTTFEYSDLKMPTALKASDTAHISITVKNTGKLAGKEVVQLYVSDKISSLVRPLKELKGFTKVNLKPGESKTVTFVLNQRAFSFYDPYKKAWVAEPGEFEILVGSSSADIRLKSTLTLS